MTTASTREPLACPSCGVPMNCHAEKLVLADADDTRDGAPIDLFVAGALEEAHCCPRCGRAATRRVTRGAAS